MLPGYPHRVVVALLCICLQGVGCHDQTGWECQSYNQGDKVTSDSLLCRLTQHSNCYLNAKLK
jgi:hypothetical protein